MEKTFWFAKCVNVNYFIGLLDSYCGGKFLKFLTVLKNGFFIEEKEKSK